MISTTAFVLLLYLVSGHIETRMVKERKSQADNAIIFNTSTLSLTSTYNAYRIKPTTQTKTIEVIEVSMIYVECVKWREKRTFEKSQNRMLGRGKVIAREIERKREKNTTGWNKNQLSQNELLFIACMPCYASNIAYNTLQYNTIPIIT